MTVFITDFITHPDIEKKILNRHLSKSFSKEISILLVWHQTCNENFLKKFPNLKVIIRYGVGTDNIDLEFAKKRKIQVANTPDYGVDEVSDTAITFLMMLTRKSNQYNSDLKKTFEYGNLWQERRIKEIMRSSEHNVCSIGAGRIGSSFLLKARAIGFNTFFYDPYLPSGYHKVLKAKRINSLEEISKMCNIITLHCPLNKETINMINKSIIKNLQKNSIIINTARGGLVNENDLSIYIKSKNLSYAADVLSKEPPDENNKLIKLWRNEEYSHQILINPHTAFYSKQAFIEMRANAANNALSYIKTGKLLNKII